MALHMFLYTTQALRASLWEKPRREILHLIPLSAVICSLSGSLGMAVLEQAWLKLSFNTLRLCGTGFIFEYFFSITEFKKEGDFMKETQNAFSFLILKLYVNHQNTW